MADVNVVELSEHSSLAAPSLVQDAHDCGDVLYAGSDVVLQRPSRLKGVEMGLVLAFKLVFVFVPVLVPDMLDGMLFQYISTLVMRGICSYYFATSLTCLESLSIFTKNVCLLWEICDFIMELSDDALAPGLNLQTWSPAPREVAHRTRHKTLYNSLMQSLSGRSGGGGVGGRWRCEMCNHVARAFHLGAYAMRTFRFSLRHTALQETIGVVDYGLFSPPRLSEISFWETRVNRAGCC